MTEGILTSSTISASPMVNILFLAGNMHSGKDTFADFIVDGSETAVKMGMSDPLIRIASYMYPLYTLEDSNAWTDQEARKVPRKELNGKTTRDILREIGDNFRLKDEFIWIRLMLRTLYDLTRNPSTKLIVVTGVRLISEAIVARSIGSLVGIRRGSFKIDDTPTEREVSFILENLCHSVVPNNGTLADLRKHAFTELAYCPKLTPRATLEIKTLERTNLYSLKGTIDFHQAAYSL